ncbi:uncharacterized protein LOC113754373 isoform X2 [Coffea eugenioides]|uniref:uncharacterized protein LOC113754373 isoform X2 n=1 Tax=Coffea eugenioides TaxID=49369 RepID=UPI000F612DC2|nr:uncharacterized protein LOC113754373 isoform X2 [Coffea eugenioides]
MAEVDNCLLITELVRKYIALDISKTTHISQRWSNFCLCSSACGAMASPFTNVAFAPSSDGVENFACKDKLSGYIFMCNGKTKADCYRYRVFGLPAARLNVVKKIRPCMTLFLFDFELKLLYGVYCATSNGGLGIEPTAFRGKFLAQVRFEIFKDCLPLPESAFKHVIKDNYNAGSKFKQELSNEQVTNLMSLFRPILTIPVPFSNILPEAEVSASYDRYVVKRILNRSGQPSNYHCSQPAHHPCSENDISVIANDTYAFPFDAISATDASVPAYAQVPSHVSGPSYGNAYASSSSGAAAYWTTEASQSLYQIFGTPANGLGQDLTDEEREFKLCIR